jgi:hypothetical protein
MTREGLDSLDKETLLRLVLAVLAQAETDSHVDQAMRDAVGRVTD